MTESFASEDSDIPEVCNAFESSFLISVFSVRSSDICGFFVSKFKGSFTDSDRN